MEGRAVIKVTTTTTITIIIHSHPYPIIYNPNRMISLHSSYHLFFILLFFLFSILLFDSNKYSNEWRQNQRVSQQYSGLELLHHQRRQYHLSSSRIERNLFSGICLAVCQQGIISIHLLSKIIYFMSIIIPTQDIYLNQNTYAYIYFFYHYYYYF